MLKGGKWDVGMWSVSSGLVIWWLAWDPGALWEQRQTFFALQEIKICFIPFKDEKSNIVAWCHIDI